MNRRVLVSLVAAWCTSCGPSVDPPAPAQGSSDDTTGLESNSTTTTTTSSTSTDPASSSTGTTASVDESSSSGSSSTGETCAVPTCGGILNECSDGEDNDGDGLFDLDDPQCLMPCDDSEQDYDFDLPGDGGDCNRDCYFDGDTGHGNDGCYTRLTCDPESPGSAIACEYQGGPACDGAGFPPVQTPECLEFCEPLTPPGCDCFGCCTIQTPAGPRDVYLEFSDGVCTPEDTTDCVPCTSQMEECGNPCDGCEICFGETMPPTGCETNECGAGQSCEDSCDCPGEDYCYLGCCYPANR